MDVITIRDLDVEAHVGVTEEERAVAQPLRLQLELRIDTRAAGASDDLEDTVDYGVVVVSVADLVRASRPSLLEHLAQKVAEELAAFKRISGVTVEVAKMKPPIPEELESVAVRIEREYER